MYGAADQPGTLLSVSGDPRLFIFPSRETRGFLYFRLGRPETGGVLPRVILCLAWRLRRLSALFLLLFPELLQLYGTGSGLF